MTPPSAHGENTSRIDIVDLRHRHRLRAAFIDQLLDALIVDVGDEDFRAGRAQRFHEVIADLARALDCEADATQIRVPVLELEARANAVQRAQAR